MYAETSISFNPKEKCLSLKGREMPAINAFIERLETNSYGTVMSVRFPVKEHEIETEHGWLFDRKKHSARLIIQAPTIEDIITNIPSIPRTEKNKTQNQYAEQMKENLHELLETKVGLCIDSTFFKNADLAAAKFYEEKLGRYLLETEKTIISSELCYRLRRDQEQSVKLYVPKDCLCKDQDGKVYSRQIGSLEIEYYRSKGSRYMVIVNMADLAMTITIRNSFLAEEQQTGEFDVIPPKTKFTKLILITYKSPKELAREELKKQKEIFEKI